MNIEKKISEWEEENKYNYRGFPAILRSAKQGIREIVEYALTEQKAELIEEVEKKRDKRENKLLVYAGRNGEILSNCNDYQRAYNQALEEIINLIKKQ